MLLRSRLYPMAVFLFFFTTPVAMGIPGRFIPPVRPHIPAPRFPLPHVPIHPGPPSAEDSDRADTGTALIWIGIVALIFGLGLIGASFQHRHERLTARATMPDKIYSSAEVAERAKQSEQLLLLAARREPTFAPDYFRAWATSVFHSVQSAWQCRDYQPVRHLLGPDVARRHESHLRAMRRYGELERIEDLVVQRLEFVHVSLPAAPANSEITLLITFQARAYFVNERTGRWTRGDRTNAATFQEFWVFRSTLAGWVLWAIEPSHESERLTQSQTIDGAVG